MFLALVWCCSTMRIFSYLIKPVDIVGEEVDYLTCGGLSHGWTAQTQCLQKEKHKTKATPSAKFNPPSPVTSWPSCRSRDTWPPWSSCPPSGRGKSRGGGARPGRWCRGTSRLHSPASRKTPSCRPGRNSRRSGSPDPRWPAAPL